MMNDEFGMMNVVLLAQAKLPTIEPWYLAAWLACAFLLLGGALMSMALVDKIRGKGPNRTEMVDKLATRRELQGAAGRIEADLDGVRAEAAAREAAREAQTVALHKRINAVAEAVEAIRGQVAGIAENQRLLMEVFLKN